MKNISIVIEYYIRADINTTIPEPCIYLKQYYLSTVVGDQFIFKIDYSYEE